MHKYAHKLQSISQNTQQTIAAKFHSEKWHCKMQLWMNLNVHFFKAAMINIHFVFFSLRSFNDLPGCYDSYAQRTVRTPPPPASDN